MLPTGEKTGGDAFWKSRHVLVTGCTGFLGAALVDRLVAQEASIVGFARSRGRRGSLGETRGDDFAFVAGSVEDYDALRRALATYEIDTVLHLAAESAIGRAMKSPLPTLETNVRGTWNVLEACRLSPGVSRVVVTSTYVPAVASPEPGDDPRRVLQPYDVSKSCAELVAATYHRCYAAPVCIARCGNLFGPGDLDFDHVVPGTMRSVLRNERPVIRGDGLPIHDFLFVDDAAEGYLVLVEAMVDPATHGQPFHLVSGQPLSVLELTRAIIELAGHEGLEPLVMNEPGAETARLAVAWEIERHNLEWAPRGTLMKRLRQTLDWYRTFLSETNDLD